MPITIYEKTDDKQEIDWLCEESWDMTEQFSALEKWLKETGKDLEKSNYIADMGTVPRTDFEKGVGGGPAFPPEAMKIMADKGIHLYISEYPPFHEE